MRLLKTSVKPFLILTTLALLTSCAQNSGSGSSSVIEETDPVSMEAVCQIARPPAVTAEAYDQLGRLSDPLQRWYLAMGDFYIDNCLEGT